MATTVTPDPGRLAVVRRAHTIIYIVMACATLYVFYCGLSGRRDLVLTISAVLVALEGLVFLGNGLRCPLTILAQRYGDPTGHVGDTLFPERCTRYTFRVFGSLYAIGVILIAFQFIQS